MDIICIRLIGVREAEERLKSVVIAISNREAPKEVFSLDPALFSRIPNSPFAYWADRSVVANFAKSKSMEDSSAPARVGLQTSDNFRFVRLHWECHSELGLSETRWIPFAKGGAFALFYADIYLRVNWTSDGAEIRAFPKSYVKNTDYYFRPGVTWTNATTSDFSCRFLPSGCIFGDVGPTLFPKSVGDITKYCAYLNSGLVADFIGLSLGLADKGRRHYDAGIIQRMPDVSLSSAQVESAVLIAEHAVRSVSTQSETCSRFVSVQLSHNAISDVLSSQKVLAASAEELVRKAVESIDNLYGKSVGPRNIASAGNVEVDEDDGGGVFKLSAQALFSYLVGVVFGRWDLSLGLKAPAGVSQQDSLSPIPSRQPGMLATKDAKLYFIEEESERKLTNAVLAAISSIWPGQSSAVEAELAELIGLESLRAYVETPSGFFADHLALYSKSRRKAPIYWPLSTRAGDFVIWVYYPKLDADSLPRLITEVLDPSLRRLNEELAGMAGEGKAGARKAKLEALRLELAEMRQDFQDLIAKGYIPNLNDGVLITACPLAKYFRLPKFRKDLEDCWKKLSRGDFDWAHLAMRMWPERATEACRCDRSIAIAHGKKDLCPAEPPKTKRGRMKPE
jgi:hypothetical protein